MKFIDPLHNWAEPQSVRAWGEQVSPRPEIPWSKYIYYCVHPDVILIAGRLLFPAFVEHEGGVFLRDRFELSVYLRWKTELGKMSAVEDMINHQHIYDLFAVNEEISEESFEGAANLMTQTLRLALKVSFPDRRFNIYTSNTEQDYGPIVGFHSAED